MAGLISDIVATLSSPTGTVWAETLQDGTSKKFRAWQASTSAPTVNDDSGDSYAIGSVWIDTAADKVYVAVDVTVGAAEWVPVASLLGATFSGDVTVHQSAASTVRVTSDTGIATLGADMASADVLAPRATFRKSRGASIASPANVAQNDQAGLIAVQAYGGGGFRNVGYQVFTVIEPTPGSGAMGGRYALYLSPLGSVTPEETLKADPGTGLYVRTVLAIDQSGRHINGSASEYTAANIASAAHAVNTTNKRQGLMVWDTTNNRMMRARGATSTSVWDVVDGSASVTPS